MVLDYMNRGSLQGLVDKDIKLEEEDVAVVAYSVLQALQVLHSLKIIHRDIKPTSILINSNGQVKLSEFGIMKELIYDQNNNLMTETFTGTICYMSPERLKGEKYSVTWDIWSLGITLLILLTGESPYSKVKSAWDFMKAIDNPNMTHE